METIIHRSRMTPCPKDVDLRNGSRREGERDTHAKQHLRQRLNN
jgi:hypothetical protein